MSETVNAAARDGDRSAAEKMETATSEEKVDRALTRTASAVRSASAQAATTSSAEPGAAASTVAPETKKPESSGGILGWLEQLGSFLHGPTPPASPEAQSHPPQQSPSHQQPLTAAAPTDTFADTPTVPEATGATSPPVFTPRHGMWAPHHQHPLPPAELFSASPRTPMPVEDGPSLMLPALLPSTLVEPAFGLTPEHVGEHAGAPVLGESEVQRGLLAHDLADSARALSAEMRSAKRVLDVVAGVERGEEKTQDTARDARAQEPIESTRETLVRLVLGETLTEAERAHPHASTCPVAIREEAHVSALTLDVPPSSASPSSSPGAPIATERPRSAQHLRLQHGPLPTPFVYHGSAPSSAETAATATASTQPDVEPRAVEPTPDDAIDAAASEPASHLHPPTEQSMPDAEAKVAASPAEQPAARPTRLHAARLSYKAVRDALMAPPSPDEDVSALELVQPAVHLRLPLPKLRLRARSPPAMPDVLREARGDIGLPLPLVAAEEEESPGTPVNTPAEAMGGAAGVEGVRLPVLRDPLEEAGLISAETRPHEHKAPHKDHGRSERHAPLDLVSEDNLREAPYVPRKPYAAPLPPVAPLQTAAPVVQGLDVCGTHRHPLISTHPELLDQPPESSSPHSVWQLPPPQPPPLVRVPRVDLHEYSHPTAALARVLPGLRAPSQDPRRDPAAFLAAVQWRAPRLRRFDRVRGEYEDRSADTPATYNPPTKATAALPPCARRIGALGFTGPCHGLPLTYAERRRHIKTPRAADASHQSVDEEGSCDRGLCCVVRGVRGGWLSRDEQARRLRGEEPGTVAWKDAPDRSGHMRVHLSRMGGKPSGAAVRELLRQKRHSAQPGFGSNVPAPPTESLMQRVWHTVTGEREVRHGELEEEYSPCADMDWQVEVEDVPVHSTRSSTSDDKPLHVETTVVSYTTDHPSPEESTATEALTRGPPLAAALAAGPITRTWAASVHPGTSHRESADKALQHEKEIEEAGRQARQKQVEEEREKLVTRHPDADISDKTGESAHTSIAAALAAPLLHKAMPEPCEPALSPAVDKNVALSEIDSGGESCTAGTRWHRKMHKYEQEHEGNRGQRKWRKVRIPDAEMDAVAGHIHPGIPDNPDPEDLPRTPEELAAAEAGPEGLLSRVRGLLRGGWQWEVDERSIVGRAEPWAGGGRWGISAGNGCVAMLRPCYDAHETVATLAKQERLALPRAHPPVPVLNSMGMQRVHADYRHDYALNCLLLAAKKNLIHVRDTQHEEEVDKWSLRRWAAPVWDRSAGIYVTRREKEFKKWYQEVGMAVDAASSPSLHEARTLFERRRKMMEEQHDEEEQRENNNKSILQRLKDTAEAVGEVVKGAVKEAKEAVGIATDDAKADITADKHSPATAARIVHDADEPVDVKLGRTLAELAATEERLNRKEEALLSGIEQLRGHATRLMDDQAARATETPPRTRANSAGCTDGRHCPQGPMDQSQSPATETIVEHISPRVQPRRGHSVDAAVSPRPNTADLQTANLAAIHDDIEKARHAQAQRERAASSPTDATTEGSPPVAGLTLHSSPLSDNSPVTVRLTPQALAQPLASPIPSAPFALSTSRPQASMLQAAPPLVAQGPVPSPLAPVAPSNALLPPVAPFNAPLVSSTSLFSSVAQTTPADLLRLIGPQGKPADATPPSLASPIARPAFAVADASVGRAVQPVWQWPPVTGAYTEEERSSASVYLPPFSHLRHCAVVSRCTDHTTAEQQELTRLADNVAQQPTTCTGHADHCVYRNLYTAERPLSTISDSTASTPAVSTTTSLHTHELPPLMPERAFSQTTYRTAATVAPSETGSAEVSCAPPSIHPTSPRSLSVETQCGHARGRHHPHLRIEANPLMMQLALQPPLDTAHRPPGAAATPASDTVLPATTTAGRDGALEPQVSKTDGAPRSLDAHTESQRPVSPSSLSSPPVTTVTQAQTEDAHWQISPVSHASVESQPEQSLRPRLKAARSHHQAVGVLSPRVHCLEGDEDAAAVLESPKKTVHVATDLHEGEMEERDGASERHAMHDRHPHSHRH